MSPLVWKPRRQWVCLTQRDGIAVDITITKLDATEFTWGLIAKPAIPFGPSSAEYALSIARSLTEAKRRARDQADALVTRLVRARGGQ